MTNVADLTEEEFFTYSNEHPEEFLVVAVDSSLRCLVEGSDFEKFLLKSLPEYVTHPVTDIPSAAIIFESMGLHLHVSALTSTGRMMDPIEVQVPFHVWMRFIIEVVAPMWDGVISAQMIHMATGRVTTSYHEGEALQGIRDELGLARNQALEPQLITLFEKLHAAHNPEPYQPRNVS